MSRKNNGFERFWKELKRRRTGKVVVTYAATAFIILQLSDILTPALSLPTWTTTLVTLLLVFGFPVAVIFSWLFDVTPEGIKKTVPLKESEHKESERKPAIKILSLSNVIIASLIVVVGILAYPRIFKRDTLDKLRSSGERVAIAVMPFKNMTNDTTWNIWQDGIQFNLIASLSNSAELKVRQSESTNNLLLSKGFSNNSSITPSVAGAVSKNLNADLFIYGSINKADTKIRINAQLIDSKTEEVFKSFHLDGDGPNVLEITDSLSSLIKNFLIISILDKEVTKELQFGISNSAEAYKSFILGYKAFFAGNNSSAINWLSHAIEIDSNFIHANIFLSLAYEKLGSYENARKWCMKLYQKKDHVQPEQEIWINWLYAKYIEKSKNDEIKYAKQLLEIDDQSPAIHYVIGEEYWVLGQYNIAIPELEKALELHRKQESKPMTSAYYELLADAYYKTGRYTEEKELLKRAGQNFPDNKGIIYLQVVLSLTEKDSIAAGKYIEKYISPDKDDSRSEPDIIAKLAEIYYVANINDKAEVYFRKALQMQPNNPVRLNSLAYFLINREINVDEGLKLVEEALKSDPENYKFIDTKGWGLYKQGKYAEALKLLEKSDSLVPTYNHESYLHLEAAKKAVTGLK